MKKLFVCLLGVGLAVLVAWYQDGVYAMRADDLAERSALAALRHLHRYEVPIPADPVLIEGLCSLLKPGAYLVSRVGIDPGEPAGVVSAWMIGWWTWLTAARLAWSIPGRVFGWYSIGAFHRWLLLAIPWRPIFRAWLIVAFWLRQHGFGRGASAKWASTLTVLAHPYRPGNSIYLGRAQFKGIGLHQPVGVEGAGHAMLIGNTGSGKTRFLGGWAGSLPKDSSGMLIDCGGDLSNSLAEPLRRAGHKTFVWDPFGITKIGCVSWNLLDEITRAAKRGGRKAAVRIAKKIARALVKELNEKQAIFTAGAREFVAALILYVWLTQAPEFRNLVTVRQFIALGHPELVKDANTDPFDALLNDMLSTLNRDDGCDGAITAVIARGASVMKSGKTREGNPFRTSALVATEFIDIPQVAETMLRSDFSLEDLKKSNTILFIAAPVEDIRNELSGYMRVLFTLTAFTFQNVKHHRKVPCAVFLDEAPHIGVEELPAAAATLRKYGIRLVVATQDLPILEAAYKGGWRTLMGSAEVRIWLANGESTTLKYMCEELGTCTVTEQVEGGWFSKGPKRVQRVERPLLYLDQARDFLDRDIGNVIATRTGKRPFRLKYDGYDSALPFWRFDPLPQYREPLLRALARWLYNLFSRSKKSSPKGDK